MARYDFLLVFYSDLSDIIELQAVRVSRTVITTKKKKKKKSYCCCVSRLETVFLKKLNKKTKRVMFTMCTHSRHRR